MATVSSLLIKRCSLSPPLKSGSDHVIWFGQWPQTNVTQAETRQILVHGACLLLLFLGTLQLPLGEQAWAILLHDEKNRPSTPSVLTAYRVSADCKHMCEQPSPTGDCLAEPSPNWFLLKAWEVGAPFKCSFLFKDKLTVSPCLDVQPLIPNSI